ncbi:sirohydrochlorin chelatase [Phaeovulum vinaykumarii]|uniref:Sirohydrochlorin ferrochelatase n=1 Tax=Phaeovulum vinaykumarii TaxID=407234 RepID=A0A1N7MA60_9RHOB|nr:CbiX/SirB N-terminal domain-containing protein [Phaeovulum vinaykumarii]SIS82984.1 Sirohydrochlorin ferrochelatase [Phaeovulum vinaykumarii]SOC10509.1 sirohydrochlorin ferrochelatase [Phaeovulum vinaykumarii]
MPDALIVAHGSPADPEPAQNTLESLAQAVERRLPGWRVRAATLAAPGALERAAEGLHAARVYPFFMAQGVFTGRILPDRLRRAGLSGEILPPFGTDPDLIELATRAVAPLAGHGVILAAHGSRSGSPARLSARNMARALRARLPGTTVAVGLIEEPPYLVDVARALPRAACLPFFALAAGHVCDDIPAALAQAGATGSILPHLGADPGVPGLISAALCAPRSGAGIVI